MGEADEFVRCYRAMIDTYRLQPDVKARQLQEILMRVRTARGYSAVCLKETGS